MSKQLKLYEDCILFWQRMGIKQEDNLIALACLDVYNAYKEESKDCYKEPFYIEKGRLLALELSKHQYDINRGHVGWLNNYNF